MKISTGLTTVAVLLALTSVANCDDGGAFGLCQYDCGPFPHRVSYNYDDIEDRDERCLCDEIDIPGRKILLVNMDDKCQVERLLREGIFVNSGDLIFFAGSSDEIGALMDWEFYSSDCTILVDVVRTLGCDADDDIRFPTGGLVDGNDFDIPDQINDEYVLNINAFEPVASGSALIEAVFFIGNLTVYDYFFDVYVDQQPCLCAVCPRECISDCYDDEAYQFCN